MMCGEAIFFNCFVCGHVVILQPSPADGFLLGLDGAGFEVSHSVVQVVKFLSHLRNHALHRLDRVDHLNPLRVWVVPHFDRSGQTLLDPTPFNKEEKQDANFINLLMLGGVQESGRAQAIKY